MLLDGRCDWFELSIGKVVNLNGFYDVGVRGEFSSIIEGLFGLSDGVSGIHRDRFAG